MDEMMSAVMTEHFDGETGTKIALWAVSVAGPDDLVPAPDRATADLWAQRMNARFEMIMSKDPHPCDPRVSASVVPWPYSAEAHAGGPGAEYAWVQAGETGVEIAPDMVNHPPHYAGTRWESIEIIEKLGNQFRLGNALKYIFRHQKKGGIEDLKKARWYLERELAQESLHPCGSYDVAFYREHGDHFAPSFGIEGDLERTVRRIASACHHTYLRMPGAWRQDVVGAIEHLNRHILGLEGAE